MARWLEKRGAVVACGGLLGEDNAAIFEKELAKYGIEDRFMRVPGLTRVNEMLVTPQGSFKVNRSAFPGVARTDLAAFVSGVATGDTLLAEWCYSGDVRMAVAAGSAACMMPGGEPPEIAWVEKLAKEMG